MVYGIICVEDFANTGDTIRLRLRRGEGLGDIDELVVRMAERLAGRGIKADVATIEECIRKVVSLHGDELLRRLVGELGEGGLKSVECEHDTCTAVIDVYSSLHGDELMAAMDEEDMDSLIEDVWWELETAEWLTDLVARCIEESGG